eukprot:CAMPEP_0170085454 /NCGR_PEP_ID=MMETSP0019_2-20121128/20323_1 /TAXON_ID=98059 /ORGANISM="Dinobryon sp., Strain UTEXLB2267" /LENGTH=619 /DNA_ID=CAMNT_0010301903 /DNA_START=397 /DNA_END=2256 /DNA_ORIENTATION=-
MRLVKDIPTLTNPKNFKLNLYTYILSACNKASHLPYALEVKAALESLCFETSSLESTNLPLIRCYCDKGEIAKAMELVLTLIDRKKDLRLRTFNPILEAYAREGDLFALLDCLQFMKEKLNLIPRSDQVAMALIAASKKKTFSTEGKVVQTINDFLRNASYELLGLTTKNMHEIVMSMNNLTSEEVVSQGVLVDSLSDIRGPILSREQLYPDGIVTALNASYSTVVVNKDILVQSNDPSIPIGLNKDNIKFVPEKYQVLDEKTKHMPNTLDPTSFSESEDNSIFYDYPFITANSSEPTSLFNHPARLVDISATSCLCPNCRQPIMPLLLTDDEKARVRGALLSIAGTWAPSQEKHLKEFGDWLRSQQEFDYIVDGANVAYFHQNFESGKFSFRQIEMIVEKLQEKIALEHSNGDSKSNKRILVLLPRCYVQKVIPNNTQKRRKSVSLSKEDEAILNRLEQDKMLYVVPAGANDDWYWMYSTIYEGRQTPAFVVTNDLMRDHKLAFLEPRPFIRWRTSHIVYFGFSSNYTSDNSTKITTPNVSTNSINNDNTITQLSTDISVDNNTAIVEEEVYLYEPGKFSREIQYSANVGRWHMPSTDRNLWLCLSTAARPTMSDSNR